MKPELQNVQLNVSSEDSKTIVMSVNFERIAEMATKNRTTFIAITIIILSWFLAIPVSAQVATNNVEVADTVLVQFDAKTTEAQRSAAINEMGGTLVEWLAPINVAKIHIQTNRVENDPISKSVQIDSLLNSARSASNVVSAEMDGVVTATFVPNDPEFFSSSLLYAPQLINADDAWDFTLGSRDVVIAILDTGVNYNHPEFTGRIVAGYDFINSDNDPMDDNGHGTHVAGIAAAGTNNGVGGVGICGNCGLMPVKVLSNTGSGLWSQVAAGVIFAADNGARVINLSLGGYSGSNTLLSAIQYAQQHGVVIVGATGNDARGDAFYPAAFPNVIGVGATDRNDHIWPLSNYGDYVDFVAPGHTIYSTSNDLNNYYGGYAFYSGTSMAAPHVTGLVGLILSHDPSRTPDQVYNLLIPSSKDLGPSGHDIHFGNGRVDALAALSQDAPPTAALNGRVWMDSNSDGLINNGENTGIAQVAIQVTASSGSVYNTVTGTDGRWHVGELTEGNYTISMVVPTNYFETDVSSRQVTLTHGQQVGNLNFGVTNMLPADSISSFLINREENKVTVEWVITRNEVQNVTVERSLSETTGYTTVGVLQAQVVGSNTVIRVVDQLPAELTDTNVYYRLRVDPTDLVVGPMISFADAGINRIFLPMVGRH